MDDVLEPERSRAIAARLALDAAGREAVEALRADGVDALVLKGPSFVHVLSRRDQRFYGDIDLLVPPTDFDRAVNTLGRIGFDRLWPSADRSEMSVHAVDLRRNAVDLDLHDRLPLLAADPATVWNALWARRARLPLGGGDVLGLDVAGVVLTAAVEMVWDGPSASRLEDDLAAAVRLLGDGVAELALLVRATGAEAVMASALGRLSDGAALARTLGVERASSIAVSLRSGSFPPLAGGFARLAESPSTRSRLRLLLREAVPSADGLAYWRPWTSRSRGHRLLGYGWRLVYVATKAPAGYLAWRRLLRADDDGRR